MSTIDLQPSMISHNVSMSFEDSAPENESTVLCAARALLSLTPSIEHDRIVKYSKAGNSSINDRAPASYYDEAHVSPKSVVHHKIVNLPCLPSNFSGNVVSANDFLSDVSIDTTSQHSEVTFENARYYKGCVPLALKEDEESLSPLHCFMRKYCVEAFSATEEDVKTPRYGKSQARSIVVGQVGIQCVHCKNRPHALRQERAVCFPSTLKNIYHSIETWQRRHSLVCQDIPQWAKVTMTDLMGKSRSGAGGRRQYWEESAMRLGLVDTSCGIRFSRPPGEISPLPSQEMVHQPGTQLHPSHALVCVEDKKVVTDYLYTLLDQMETCYFSEQDRTGGRSKVKNCPTGYPGLQCKHCSGKAGFGRYFPSTLQALTSANSDRNIFNHVVKCRRCPIDIQEKLSRFVREHQNTKNRRGTRKVFFERVWNRMHG